MQRMELSFLAAWPSSQRALIAEGQPVVLEISLSKTEAIETTLEVAGNGTAQ